PNGPGPGQSTGASAPPDTRERESPALAVRAQVELERPRVARLVMEHPVGLADRRRVHQRVGRQRGEVAPGGLDALAHEGGVDARVDHEMRDVDVLGPELARHALRERSQPELRRRERRVALAAAISSTSGASFSAWRRPTATVKPPAANRLAIAAPM